MIIAGSSTSSIPYTGRSSAACSCGQCAKCATPATSVAGTSDAKSKQVMLESLKSRDREVRNHEAAHLAAAGGLAKGGPTFSYQRGPDGQFYAIGGEVQIDTSPVPGDPEATLRKADTIRRAALAPASPSGPDHQVAASATALETKARAELATLSKGEKSGLSHYRKTDADHQPRVDLRA